MSLQRFGKLAFSAFVLAYCASAIHAQDASVVVDPAAQPELIPAQTTEFVPAESAPPVSVPAEELAVPQDGVVVHPVAEINYDVTRRARRAFAGAKFVELSMVTQNPADGCFYEIPLCVPECCLGEPQVESYCGLLGRGVVKYCYECGLEVEVIFRLRGDVKVEYGI
ncbi:MAG: hypothetical protein AB7G28_18290 [Pirellulales bacterium]